ncbi:MAG TPA: flagellar motor switch protein FliN [Bryobacteraceae bacterium]|nr:flagellar motor switch protein FliN [Bryobacteraceae bacterium]
MPSELTQQTALSWLLRAWRPKFAESLGTITGLLVEASDSAADEVPADSLWWDQPLSLGGGMSVRIGAAPEVWQAFGTAALEAAGLQDTTEDDVRGTYLEILGQSLSGLATVIGSLAGREVTCEAGQLEPTAFESALGAHFQIHGGPSGTMWLSVSNELLSTVLAASDGGGAPQSGTGGDWRGGQASAKAAYDLLLDVEMPVSVSFGRAHIPLKEVLKLTSGSIVELNRTVTEPVEIIVNNCVIAKGEVVVIEGNYGVRIHQVISRNERLRTLY